MGLVHERGFVSPLPIRMPLGSLGLAGTALQEQANVLVFPPICEKTFSLLPLNTGAEFLFKCCVSGLWKFLFIASLPRGFLFVLL